MGEAKRRKQQLGDLYGTPEGSSGEVSRTESTAAKHYDQNGRAVNCRMPCPKCKHPITRALITGDSEGVIVRRRQCADCGHRFYTAQEPEYLIPDDRIYYVRSRPQIIFDEE